MCKRKHLSWIITYPNLGKEMDKLTKILIVVVIILVAGLSLSVGLLLGNNMNQPANVVNNTTNSTNSSQNNQTTSTDQEKSSNTGNNYISESQAISIAKSAWPVSGATYYVNEYPTSDSPRYTVTCHVPNYEGSDGYVTINAYTGEVVLKGT